MNRSRLLGLTLAALIILAPTFFREAPKARAETPVEVTFTITQVQEVNCGEGDFEACPNDYYPKFDIDRQGLSDGKDRFCCAHGRDFSPNWVFSRVVDSAHNPVAIHVELFDQDDLSADDQLDIAKDAPRSLDLTFDLNTCTFQGGGLTRQQGAGVPSLLQGQSEGSGSDSARIFFTITTRFCIEESYKVDSDGDGLFNGWESWGMDIDAAGNVQPVLDGVADLALGGPVFNADPYRKDLFVEVDWMACSAGGCAAGDTHSHAPVADVLKDVVKAFADAPVENPDGTKGITLHAMSDEAVADRAKILFTTTGPGAMDDFDDIKLGNPHDPCKTGRFGTAADRAAPNCSKILGAKRLVFRYMIFGHSYITPRNPNDEGSSGVGELGSLRGKGSMGGNDFMVTLGAFSADVITDAGGQQAAEASTFMHEIGHTLGLNHGGGDSINCKPNYLSVMNYTLQFSSIDPNRPMDYSRAALGTLNEDSARGGLNETKGIGGPKGRLTIYGVGGTLRTDPADGSVNWNAKNGLEPDAAADINFISTISPSSEDGGCSTASPNQELKGFDDWQNIVYNFRDSPDFADGVRGPTAPELTADMIVAMSARADLKLAKLVDKASAVGGETLNYTVPVTNMGRGKAINVSLTDTLPDGSTQTRSLPVLDTDGSDTQTFTFVVPCATPDGTVLTNRAFVTGTDEQGRPDPKLSDNTAQASTTIHAPVLALSTTATASVNAGESITYTITYENTGGGMAGSLVITQVLPAGIYYSKALDLGAGPKPDTVTLNSDGTRTLRWNVGAVRANSGQQQIIFSARPTLLALEGTSYTSHASLSFENANGCVYDTLNASASTKVTVVPPTRDPRTLGFWRNHSELWQAETLARLQATDQRYDTDSAAGALASSEITTAFQPGGHVRKVLEMQLLATYFNLATRQIEAATVISSPAADRLGLTNIRDAVLYATATLLLPVDATTQDRYSDAIRVLDEINANKSEVY